MANEIVYTLRGNDLWTPTVDKAIQSYTRLDHQARQYQRTLSSSIPTANQWERQMSRLTTVNGLAFEAFRRFNSMISGFFIGGAVGLVITALSSVTDQILLQVRAWFDASVELEKYKKLQQSIDSGLRDHLLTLQAQKLQTFDQIKAQREVVEGLEKQLSNERLSASYRMALINQLSAEDATLKSLEARYNDLAKSIKTVNEQVNPPATKVPKKPTLEELGIDQFRMLNSQYRQDEEEMLRNLEENQATRIGTERAAATQIAQIRQYEQDQQLNIMQHGMAQREQVRQMELEREQNKAFAIQFIFASLMAFQNSNSRAMFRVAQIAAIADATVHTYMAANKALASAPPPWNYALAAGVVAAGLANVARISSTRFGGGAGGGGGGSISTPRTVGTGEADQGATGSQRVTIDITLSNVVFADERSAVLLAHTIMPALAKNLEENDFNIGNVQLAGTRR